MRGAATIISLVGLAGSLALMFVVGRHQRSPILVVLFTGWVAAPFVALLIANSVAHRRRRAESTLLAVSSAVAVVSLAIYAAVAFGPSRPQPARFFLLVPTVALVVVAIVVALALREQPAPNTLP